MPTMMIPGRQYAEACVLNRGTEPQEAAMSTVKLCMNDDRQIEDNCTEVMTWEERQGQLPPMHSSMNGQVG